MLLPVSVVWCGTVMLLPVSVVWCGVVWYCNAVASIKLILLTAMQGYRAHLGISVMQSCEMALSYYTKAANKGICLCIEIIYLDLNTCHHIHTELCTTESVLQIV